ncbi:MAG: integrase arm-type DNA-binding domain-containing protein [Gammaproteobacteria bacterium]|nr:integrase arm-type DNA-binding domain-containing protein [Gammaproteobacteria bacterium]
MTFTVTLLDSLKPRDKPYRKWEGASDKGFGIQVTPKGVKTFYQFYRWEGKRCFLNLGNYPDTKLKDARDVSRQARALLDQGLNPREVRQSEKDQTKRNLEIATQQKREEEMKGSVQQLFDLYLAQMKADKKNSWQEIKRAFDKNVLPILGPSMKAKEVKPQNIRLILHKIIERGSLIQANRVRSYLSAAFRYGIEHDFDPKNLNHEIMFGLEANPVRDVPKPQKAEKPGERDLTMDEIKAFWLGFTGHHSLQTEMALKLILTTGGQRVQEVLWATWNEFDLDNKTWEIPSSRTKNGRVHLLPLNEMSLGLLETLKKETGNQPYLFPKAPGYKDRKNDLPYMPVTSLSRAIYRFCFAEEPLSDEGKKPKLIERFKKFTPRDLRRTCKTRMGEMGISKEIRDRIHNHALTDVSSKHYDRYDYLPEKRKALDAWGKRLAETCSLDNLII